MPEGNTDDMISLRRLQHQVRALEEAICPRVAARLTALERKVGLAPPAGPSHHAPEHMSLHDLITGSLRTGSNEQTRVPTRRKSCTSGQVDAVARKINAIMGGKPWIEQSPIERSVHRGMARRLIHAVLDVMG